MIGVVEERDVLRPFLGRERVQPLHLRLPAAVSQERQHARHVDRVVEPQPIQVGLPDQDHRRARLRAEQSLHRRQRRRLVPRHHLALPGAGREEHQERRGEADDHTESDEGASVGGVPSGDQVEGADRRHDRGGGHHRPDHHVWILPAQPRVREQRPQTAQIESVARARQVTDWVLHEGVGRDDEEARDPRAEKDQECRHPVAPRAESLLAEQQGAEKRRLQKEREDALHRQRLSDDAAGGARETRPVRAELKLHRDAGHHAHGEVDGEDTCPEARRPVVVLAPPAQRLRLQDQDEQRQPHGELREEIVVGDGEREVQAIDPEGGVHTAGEYYRTAARGPLLLARGRPRHGAPHRARAGSAVATCRARRGSKSARRGAACLALPKEIPARQVVAIRKGS